MNAQFKKGQLVAVRNSDEFGWKMFVYDHEEDGRHFCTWPEYEDWGATDWKCVRPVEEVWPDIFIGRARKKASAIYQNTIEQHRQIEWLCEQLQAVVTHYGAKECPPEDLREECHGNCQWCWQYASLKALEEPEEEDEEEDDA